MEWVTTLDATLQQVNPWVLLTTATLISGVACITLMHRRQSRRVNEAYQSGVETQTIAQADERRLQEEGYVSLQQDLFEAQNRSAADSALIDNLRQQLGQLRDDLAKHQSQLAASQATAAANAARLDEAQKGFAEKESLFRQTSDQLKKEFELLANKVLDNQGVRHQTTLQNVLSPFRDQMSDFKKKVEEVYLSDTKERATLLSEIKNLQNASERINTEAENLTKALKGDKKLQGNWGELVLERVLEDSGLRKDHEYFLQTTQRDVAGDMKRPDVLIQLPDSKDVVVDSKMTLNAYEEALSAEDEVQRDRLVRQHLANLRAHVKRLSEQDYDRLPNVRSLDFVLLFVPIESAFTLAMEHDHKLFTEAFAQRIVIVSPTTLMMTLRIINNVWRYEKQNRNAQEIAQKAGALYDKLRVIVEEMERLGTQLNTVQKTYDGALSKLTTGKGNLVRQVEQFRELGAYVKKPLSTKLIDRAADED